MRKSLLLCLLCFISILAGCTTMNSESPKNLKKGQACITYLTFKHQPKRGHIIAFYSEKTFIKRPYRIIGKETISRYNLIGFERQTKILQDLMKSLAASMGGDAVINITSDKMKIEGTVISFEKVIL